LEWKMDGSIADGGTCGWEESYGSRVSILSCGVTGSYAG
jgi:hypothetical protein